MPFETSKRTVHHIPGKKVRLIALDGTRAFISSEMLFISCLITIIECREENLYQMLSSRNKTFSHSAEKKEPHEILRVMAEFHRISYFHKNHVRHAKQAVGLKSV